MSLLRPYQIQIAIDESGSGATSLSSELSALEAVRTGLGRTNMCPKCRGAGTHAKSEDTGNSDDTDLIPCTLVANNVVPAIICDSWGFLTAPVRMIPSHQYEAI